MSPVAHSTDAALLPGGAIVNLQPGAERARLVGPAHVTGSRSRWLITWVTPSPRIATP